MWYSAGTVAVTANSATVTGTGTAFSANARVGDAFIGPDLGLYEVTNVASTTVISIRPNYRGATASGQSYAIAPLQGYVKESADRLRQFVEQFGSQLAALQPWATSATAAAAREALGTNDAANLTAGLINVARIPATLTPDKAFRRGNILGTVSQSGGVPTGAIIERGSNANGEYVRYADGTQECWVVATLSTALNGNMLPSYNWTFPAAFSVIPVVEVSTSLAVGDNPVDFRSNYIPGNWGTSNTFVNLGARLINGHSPLSGEWANCKAVAKGRWY